MERNGTLIHLCLNLPFSVVFVCLRVFPHRVLIESIIHPSQTAYQERKRYNNEYLPRNMLSKCPVLSLYPHRNTRTVHPHNISPQLQWCVCLAAFPRHARSASIMPIYYHLFLATLAPSNAMCFTCTCSQGGDSWKMIWSCPTLDFKKEYRFDFF